MPEESVWNILKKFWNVMVASVLLFVHDADAALRLDGSDGRPR
jgi:hypothetical protein